MTTNDRVVRQGGRHGGTHTKKNVPYTRSGDQGTSQLFTGERRRKDDAVFDAMGQVDELCAFVGVVHAELSRDLSADASSESISADEEDAETRIDERVMREWLLDVMSRLFDIGALVAKPRSRRDDDDDDDRDADADFNDAHVERLEHRIDVMTESLPELMSFVLPTGGRTSAHLHVARTVCRRCERSMLRVVEDGVCDPRTLRYVNRLSDFLFTAGRWANYAECEEEIMYKRYSTTQRNKDDKHDARRRTCVAVKLK